MSPQDKYNDATEQIDQTVSVNGAVVSTLSTTSGVGAGWGTGKLFQAYRATSLAKPESPNVDSFLAMECQQTECGTVPEHHYLNTTLIMDVADPSYSQTLGLNGASGDLVTADGGKTWTVAEIKIDEYTYQ